MKLVQIKGANGSGKTTIVKQMLALDDDYYYLTTGDGVRDWVVATVIEEIGWAGIGRYDDRPFGGCDTLKTVDEVKSSILDAVHWGIEAGWAGVVFEGMMISTIKTTFYNYLLKLAEDLPVEPLFVILQATPEGCISRLGARGTKKPNLRHDNIRAKCEMVVRHAKTYDPSLVRWIDVEATPEYRMLSKFMAEVGDPMTIAKAIVEMPWEGV